MGTLDRLEMESAARHPAPQPVHVLLVDDDGDVRSILALMLEDAGYAVVESEDPADALARLGQEPAFGLLITDYTMPAMTGTELIRRARLARPGLPAVLITGHVGADLAPVVDGGPGAILAKPFPLGDLTAAAGSVLLASPPWQGAGAG